MGAISNTIDKPGQVSPMRHERRWCNLELTHSSHCYLQPETSRARAMAGVGRLDR